MTSEIPERRPGPFGPVIDLLPKDQTVEVVRHDTPVFDAIERMQDNEYSQLPVMRDGEIIGLFSWRSFGQLVGIPGTESDVNHGIKVEECLRKVEFLAPDAFIDTGIDWIDKDCILVGSPKEVHGLLAIYDVVGRLQDFGEAFFLLHEVEHLLRDMLTEAVGADRIGQLIRAMSVPSSFRRQPEALTDLTFALYGDLACSKKRWPEFHAMFFGERTTMKDHIEDVAKVRNAVFHFKRPITADDVDQIRRFRTRLLQQRQSHYHKHNRQA